MTGISGTHPTEHFVKTVLSHSTVGPYVVEKRKTYDADLKTKTEQAKALRHINSVACRASMLQVITAGQSAPSHRLPVETAETIMHECLKTCCPSPVPLQALAPPTPPQ